jgi:tRNA threonylcarbamoyl adenosine modification protein YjeE
MIDLVLPDEAATQRLGADLALALRKGDVLALSGDLGAGKSTLARAIVRTLAADDELDVPSPTFTLVQTYAGRVPIGHFDLYRIADAFELDELGLSDVLADGAALIEWPERAEGRLPAGAVTIRLDDAGDGRRATIAGAGGVVDRIARSLAIRDFLHRSGRADARRTPFPGDASARGYELVDMPDEPQRVLMDSPPLVLGPPVRDGKPYAVIARTSRTIAAFVAVDRLLADAGIAVPDVLAADLDHGFALLSHLGSCHFLDQGKPVAERYAAAAELLAFLHARPLPHKAEAAPGVVHAIPPFDRAALMIEADLLLDWYVPWKTGVPASDALRADFASAWTTVLDGIAGCETGVVLRDYHSPNIVWRPERSGLDRMGVLDFQDALIGPLAYDVASLAMDARVTLPPETEASTVAAYVAARHAAGSFDDQAFSAAYAAMAAQRNTKILGIFVRLNERDGKPAYLQHLPRIRDYLRRALAHPALAPLDALYRRHGLLSEDA